MLEVGCGDAFGTRIVLQEVQKICAIDFDPVFVQDVQERMDDKWPFDCRVHDMVGGPVDGPFDAAYSIDVLEHIQKFIKNRIIYNIVNLFMNIFIRETGI